MRRLSPLPLLGHLRVGLFDQGAKPGEGLAPPVAQFFDPCIYQLSWRLDLLRGVLLHVADVTLLCWWAIGPSTQMATAADGSGAPPPPTQHSKVLLGSPAWRRLRLANRGRSTRRTHRCALPSSSSTGCGC